MDNYTRYIQPEQIAHDILMAMIQKMLKENKLSIDIHDIFDYYCQQYQSTYQEVRFTCSDKFDNNKTSFKKSIGE